MYQKNAASPPPVYATVVSATDGSPITADVAAYHVHGTTRGAGGGTLTHIANGKWAYTPTQAETDYSAFAIEFYHADAVGDGPAVEVVTDQGTPAAILEDTGTTLPAAIAAVGITITPVASTVSAGAVSDGAITAYQHAAFGPYVFTVVDDDGVAVDLSAKTLVFRIWQDGRPGEVLWSLSGADISVGGADSNQVTVSDDDTNTGAAGTYRYSLWNTTDDTLLARGVLTIVEEGEDAT